MTIVYNQNPGGVTFNVQGEDDDTQRTYKGTYSQARPVPFCLLVVRWSEVHYL
jgi:hypothetical protein